MKKIKGFVLIAILICSLSTSIISAEYTEPIITSPGISDVDNDSAIATVTITTGYNCSYGIWYGTIFPVTEANADGNISGTGSEYNEENDSLTLDITGLTPGQLYYTTSWVSNPTGFYNTNNYTVLLGNYSYFINGSGWHYLTFPGSIWRNNQSVEDAEEDEYIEIETFMNISGIWDDVALIFGYYKGDFGSWSKARYNVGLPQTLHNFTYDERYSIQFLNDTNISFDFDASVFWYRMSFSQGIFDYNSSINANNTCENFCQQGGIWDDVDWIFEIPSYKNWEKGAGGNTLTTIGSEYWYEFKLLNRTVNLSFVYDLPNNDSTFLTKPNPPTNLNCTYNTTQVNLSWDNGDGFNKTVVVVKIGAYPDGPNDGTVVYNGSGGDCTDTDFDSYASRFYRIWSYTNWTYGSTTLTQWSTTYDENHTAVADFQIYFSPYLDVGQYIEATGMIVDIDTGQPLTGFVAETTVRYTNGSVVLGPVPHNCSDGNYEVALPTSTLRPDIYDIVVEFENATGVTFAYSSRLYLNVDPPEGTYAPSELYFHFFDNNTGQGIEPESFKIYADRVLPLTSADRRTGNKFKTYTSDTVYYRIDDYFDNQIYPTTGTYESVLISSIEQNEDIPIDWYSFSVKNMNHSIVKFTITNGSRTDTQFLYPYEPFYWHLLSGDYNLTKEYINPETGGTIEILYDDISITSDAYYWIRGYDLQDIIIEVYAVNSTLGVIEINIITNIDLVNSTVDFINQTIWNELTFMNTSVNEVNTRIINIWTSQNSSFGNLENRSMIVFSIYNTNEALGLDRDTLKVYINGTRLIGNIYYANRTDVLNLTIKDYYNSTLYQGNHTVVAPLTFIDLGLTFHSWLFGNKNNIDYMISILKQGGSRWWERGIVPYGEREFIIPSGTYALRIYYNNSGVYTEIYNSTLPPSINVVNSKVYVIEGDDLVEVLSGLSVIRGQLIEVRTELDDAFMPDVTIISRNPPMIFSVYDVEGMAIGGYYKICPPLITIATTRVTQYGNWINSTPMVPGNGSVLNGTVTILRDVLYLSGPNSITWVNITYTGNGSLFGNTSYIPSRIDIYSENLTIRSDGNLSVLRVTKYNQVKKFFWNYYQFSGYGPDPERAGWHEAGIEIINCLPVPLYEVYAIVGFSDKSSPDGNSVTVKDTANDGIILERGPDYDVTDVAIHFNLLSLNALETRVFTLGYYKQELESYIYDEAIVSIPMYEHTVWSECSYNTFSVHWTNQYDRTFRGALYVKLDFSVPTDIDTETMRIWDVTNDHELDRSLFIPGRSFIRISAEAISDVLPGSSRKFDVYFLMTEFPGADPREFHLDTEIYMGITPFLIIFLLGVGFIILGAYFASSDKKNKDRWKFCVSVGIFIVVVIYIMNMMGL